MRGGVALLILAWASAEAPSALAQSSEPDSHTSDHVSVALLEVGLGVHHATAYGETCSDRGDLTICEQSSHLAGLRIAPRARFRPELSIGVLTAMSWGSGLLEGEESRTWWHACADLRWHPYGARPHRVWLGINGGVVVVVDDLNIPGFGPYSTVAPDFGLSTGVDFRLVDSLTISPLVRVFWTWLGQADDPSDEVRPAYSNQLGVAMGLEVTLHLAGP